MRNKKPQPKRETGIRALKEEALLEEHAPAQIEPRHDAEMTNARLREMATIDFVSDPEQRPVLDHYSRVDRPWRKHVSMSTFYNWANDGKWLERRARWWDQIEARILAKRAEHVAIQRVSEIEAMESARDNMARYLFPLTTKGGAVRLHPDLTPDGKPNPLAGMPMYGLRMPSLDRFIASFVALDKQIMLKRGEAIERTVNERLPDVDAHESGGLQTVSPEDLRAMAKALVRRRQPELAEQPEIIIRAERPVEDD